MNPQTPGLDLPPATHPTMYFIGVTASESSINRVFPLWLPILGIRDARLVSLDVEPGAHPSVFRQIVSAIAADPASLGALVTTHKVDVYDACRDQFDELSTTASALREVSCIAKRGTNLIGDALDIATSGAAATAIVPPDHWRQTGGEALLFGAGGAATALMCHLAATDHEGRPQRVVVTSRTPARLSRIVDIHRDLGLDLPLETRRVTSAAVNDDALSSAVAGSLIVNATGLGKDAPGSPITDEAEFPSRGIAWDFNYRGDLRFLVQARAQASQRSLRVEDGWRYFVHGWTQHIVNVFELEPTVVEQHFDELSSVAASAR